MDRHCARAGALVFAIGLSVGATEFATAQTGQTLDAITVVATRTEEKAIDTLAPVSVLNQRTIEMINPSRLNEIFHNVPGVTFQDRGDSPESAINIRGLQDFGRVAIVVDGARQNYQRSGHNAQGSFFLDPELLAGADVVRGPTANIYGSGAIGGVVSFRTKDVDDVVRPGRRWGTTAAGMLGSNAGRAMASSFTGVRVNPNLDVFFGGAHRTQKDFKDGEGLTVSNTGNHVSAGIAKITARPADGHEVKLTGIFQEDLYNIGQFNRGPIATAAQRALYQGSSVYASEVHNYTATAGWRYARPDDPLFDWDGKIYWNRTYSDQTKTAHLSTTAQAGVCTTPGNNVSGCVGDTRGYQLDTFGFDVHNTTRFNLGPWRNAVTLGGDGFKDDVNTSDPRGNSHVTTPGGIRTVSGGFVQWKANYAHWLEIVSAARYDNYRLEATNTGSDGERISPKITLGITPVPGLTPYISYAEGYRAPSLTETIIAGAHATGGGPNLFTCPDGGGGLFCFLPNPNLRPEVGKSKEIGLNMKYDNVFAAGDSFRGKFNLFRNDIDDYIELTASAPVLTFGLLRSQYYQYQNLPHARINGFEAETMYDAGAWFVGLSGQYTRGKNVDTGVGLVNIQPNRIVTTAGVRLLERTLTLAGSWTSAASNQNVPVNYLPNDSYELVNFYLTWIPRPDFAFHFGIDNVLDRYYRPYAMPQTASDGTTQNDVLWASPPPGTVYKASLRVQFGAM
ncbi:MAG: TonB-dependent hemoglobin/transferrin/lactoferrin family receptor [Pseudorhodoplanes sp.]|nr:MAG: TonB-dependent hemoglobin/transferrin/lactoferrin family receptor [Pseudorhodoplanes sp.]